MPAPRSVLIDIHDRGLNPKVAHKSTDSSGRIRGVVAAEPQSVEVSEPKKKNAIKSLKKIELPDEPTKDEITTVASGEATVDVVTNEGAGSVEPKHEEEAVVETPAVRPRGKRNAPNNA